MRPASIDDIIALQKNPKNIRNICILAHVDHGKTTMADCLIASNGIISQRLAGKLRYMDSRPDEQKRGITMKSSAISLHYHKGQEHYLINLIDSPGHIDFSSEVSTAVRLCDGALVLVDAVEGVCPQTHAVLRQAWLENIQPCLVLNKIDRLITELKLSPLEAYLHLQQILEQVNAITGSLFTSHVMEMNADEPSQSAEKGTLENEEVNENQVYDWDAGLVEADDSHLYFSPDQGNVKFASAIDGWAFGIDDFAEMFSKKLGVKVEILNKTLWGDYYLNTKTKRIMKGAQSKGKKPLFVQFILENIWKVYEAVLETRDKEKVEKIVASLGLTISARDSRYSDPKVYLTAILRQWLPLSEAVLGMVSSKLPSPLAMAEERIEKLMCGGLRKFDSLPVETRELKQAFKECSASDAAPVIAFVSKMVSVPQEFLPKYRKRPLTHDEIEKRREIARQKNLERKEAEKEKEDASADNVQNKDAASAASEQTTPLQNEVAEEKEEQENFVAFARVFSGTIRKGQKIYVLGPKYDPAKGLKLEIGNANVDEVDFDAINRETASPGFGSFEDVDVSKHMAVCEVGDIYLMMGREFEHIDHVAAGNIVAINGLKNFVLKSATLSSSLACPAFTPMPFEARPIVRVALEPKQPSELPLLVKGLKLLNQADPCVRVLVQQTGEYVIVTAGEVHLQRCLEDLRNRYAGIEIAVSSPITPFKETVVERPTIDMANEDIVESNSSQHIERLPAFMLREVQDWDETIKIKSENVEVSPEVSKEEAKRNKYNEDRKSKCAKSSLDVGIVEARTANKTTCVSIRAMPLPVNVTKLLESNFELMRAITHVSSGQTAKERKELHLSLAESTRNKIKQFYNDLKQCFEEAGQEWSDVCDLIWSFGPRAMGPNVLLNRIQRYKRQSVWSGLIENESPDDSKELESIVGEIWDYDNSIVSGFQLATLSGPMCEEPMMGVCFVVEDWRKLGENHISSTADMSAGSKDIEDKRVTIDKSQSNFSKEYHEIEETEDVDNSENSLRMESGSKLLEVSEEEHSVHESVDELRTRDTAKCNTGDRSTTSKSQIGDTYGPLSGQLISAVKEGCRRAFMSQPMRLMAAMYSCEIHATTDVLGKMYAVISKREGRILSDDMKEGTDIFNVKSVLPVVESFGFSEEIRKKTSGLASPQLVFSHWEVIDVDPFWIPTTEEEYLLYGEKADSENQALKYVISVRKRKGLYVEEKTVEFAEKQRTLKKNK